VKDFPIIKVHQHDWIPGWSAFAATDDGEFPNGEAHIAIDIGGMVAALVNDQLGADEMPYFVAECIMHEVIHVLEQWAGVEFSEDRVEALIEKYQEARRALEKELGTEEG